MNDRYVEDIWNVLKNAVQKILKKEDVGQLRWEELYRYVLSYVNSKDSVFVLLVHFIHF